MDFKPGIGGIIPLPVTVQPFAAGAGVQAQAQLTGPASASGYSLAASLPPWLRNNHLACRNAQEKISFDHVEHSITLEAIVSRREKGRWGSERIVLDGIQNHLPGDSGGTKVEIRYRIKNRWYQFRQGRRLAAKGEPVSAVAFSDDGRGFDYRKLGIDYSDKPLDNRTRGVAPLGAVGQFGEGLKLATAAALAEGMAVEIFSRNWRAVPMWKPMPVEGTVVRRLKGFAKSLDGVQRLRAKCTAA